jgi:hypothetical protein
MILCTNQVNQAARIVDTGPSMIDPKSCDGSAIFDDNDINNDNGFEIMTRMVV